MDSIHITLATLGVICAGAGIGFIAQRFLREYHMSAATQDVAKLTTGVVATLAALVLGLLVASAKQSFDNNVTQARSFVINMTLLDRSMRLYEPPMTAERKDLLAFAKTIRQRIWEDNPALDRTNVLLLLDHLRNRFRQLKPGNEQDSSLKDRYISLSDGMILAADELLEQDATTIPLALVVIVDGWLAVVFLGFGLFAPFNSVSVASIFIGAVSVALSMFMIVEMNSPFQGFITVSPNLMDRAIVQISTD